MTGAGLFSRRTAELSAHSRSWEPIFADSISHAGGTWRRRLRILREMPSADLWYSCGGIRSGNMELLARTARALGVPGVVHWIGTDVLHAKERFGLRPQQRAWIAAELEHWACAPWLVAELAEIGIGAELVPFTSAQKQAYLSMPVPPLPARFTVLAYIPAGRPDFYGWPHVQRLALEFPGLAIEVLGATRQRLPDAPPNVRLLGWVDDTLEVFRRCTVVVRMTVHDGYAEALQEPVALARHAIWTRPFPGVRLAHDYATLHDHVAELLRQHEAGLLAPNETGRAYIAGDLAPGRVANQFVEHLLRAAAGARPQRRVREPPMRSRSRNTA